MAQAKTYSFDSLSAMEATYQSLYENNLKRIREHIDFSSFSGFVSFGSAEIEVDLAIAEILDDYPTFQR